MRNLITIAALGVAAYALWKLQQERKDCAAVQAELDKHEARRARELAYFKEANERTRNRRNETTVFDNWHRKHAWQTRNDDDNNTEVPYAPVA